jgi:hypothetical protein
MAIDGNRNPGTNHDRTGRQGIIDPSDYFSLFWRKSFPRKATLNDTKKGFRDKLRSLLI